MSKWIAEFDLEDGDKMPEHMDLNYMGVKIDFHCRPMWIPVTEETELPDHDVICCNNEGDIAQGYLYFDEEEKQIACDHDPYVMFGIVAYMELPEPYKEGSE